MTNKTLQKLIIIISILPTKISLATNGSFLGNDKIIFNYFPFNNRPRIFFKTGNNCFHFTDRSIFFKTDKFFFCFTTDQSIFVKTITVILPTKEILANPMIIISNLPTKVFLLKLTKNYSIPTKVPFFQTVNNYCNFIDQRIILATIFIFIAG